MQSDIPLKPRMGRWGRQWRVLRPTYIPKTEWRHSLSQPSQLGPESLPSTSCPRGERGRTLLQTSQSVSRVRRVRKCAVSSCVQHTNLEGILLGILAEFWPGELWKEDEDEARVTFPMSRSPRREQLATVRLAKVF